MYRINLLAILFLFGAAIIANLLSWLFFPDNVMLVGLLGGALIFLADGVYRLRQTKVAGREQWFGAAVGGQLVIFPMWVIGILLIIFGLVQPHLE